MDWESIRLYTLGRIREIQMNLVLYLFFVICFLLGHRFYKNIYVTNMYLNMYGSQ